MKRENMTEFRKPDFRNASRKADEILITSRVIQEFPFEIHKLINEQTDIRLCSFEKAMHWGIDVNLFGSESAVLMELDGMNIIFFNQNEPRRRIRFSIAHEFGHYVLDHKKNLNKQSELYGIQEVEANCFAAQLLMPCQLIDECIRREIRITSDIIMNLFGVSKDASSKRIDTLTRIQMSNIQMFNEYDDQILWKYLPFLKQHIPDRRFQYNFEDEYQKQNERDSWLSQRF